VGERPFPYPLTVTENFRVLPDQDPITGWTARLGSTAPQVVAGEGIGDGSYRVGSKDTVAACTDLIASIEVGEAVTGSMYAGITYRLDTATNDGYEVGVWVDAGQPVAQLYDLTAGAYTTIRKVQVNALAVGDRLGIFVAGNRHQAWLYEAATETWTLVIDEDDSGHTAAGLVALDLGPGPGLLDFRVEALLPSPMPFTRNHMVRRQREPGFSVTVDHSSQDPVKVDLDLRDRVAALRYDMALPGGFQTCSFLLRTPYKEVNRWVTELDPIVVRHGDHVAWEGAVEEVRRADQDTSLTEVLCLGHASVLKDRQTVRRVYLDASMQGWMQGSDRGQGYSNSTVPQYAAPTTEATDGTCIQITYPANGAVGTSDDASLIWEAPPGCFIAKVVFNYRTAGANASWSVVAADTLPATAVAAGWAETVKASASIASASGTTTYTMSGATRRFLQVYVDKTTGSTPAGDEYVRLYGIEIYCVPHPTGGTLANTTWTAPLVARDLVNTYGTAALVTTDAHMRPATYTFPNLVFPSPTTPEQILTYVMDIEGMEWGVFDDRILLASPMLQFHRPAGFLASYFDAVPNWWLTLQGADGAVTDLRASMDGVVNRVVVAYTDTAGRPQEVEVTDYTNPFNPLNNPGSTPRRIRDRLVTLPGVATTGLATQAANAYLADWGRPIVRGTVTIPLHAELPLDGGPAQIIPAALVRPGMWVEVTDMNYLAGGAVTITPPLGGSSPTMPPGLLPIRAVSVDAPSRKVACTIDTTPTRFRALLAALQAGAVALR